MQRRFYPRIILIAALLCAHALTSFGQKGFFQPVPNARLELSKTRNIQNFSLFNLKTGDLKSYLQQAPLEFKSKTTKGLTLEIPLPDGTVEIFNVFESPFLAPQVAVKHPEIKTYWGKGTIHGDYSMQITLTSTGLNAIILGVNGESVYIDKVGRNHSENLYMTYFTHDATSPVNTAKKSPNNRCGTVETKENQNLASFGGNAAVSTGATLRTFRLAMAANAEFTTFIGTQANAFNALVAYVSNMNAVFRKELSVRLELVSGINLVYTNAATDPYTGDPSVDGQQITMLDENQTNLDAIFTSAGYDVGHVLGYLGGSGGGIASSPSVCDDETKAQGVSGVGDGSFAPIFDDQLIQHEIGHQFGMSHSYNSNVPVCTTRAFATSVEPGSGTTIMSYGYTCSNTNAGDGLVGDDDYEQPAYSPILNFHAVNYTQANNYISTLSCFTFPGTGNSLPAIAALTPSWVIPKSTPFALTGSAVDADATDVLTYSWEGTNISDQSDKGLLTATTISDTSKPPFFRSYLPTSSGTRYYPRLEAILDGTNYAIGDKLPSVQIVTTHRLTVRDNNSGVATENVQVTVDGTAGPFLITSNLAASYEAGTSQTMTWNVAGTDNTSTVNCLLVDIFLSIDGGLTWLPTKLAEATANDGTQSVTFPNNATTQGRIKVAATNGIAGVPGPTGPSGRILAHTPNIFFDISNSNFEITAAMPVTLTSFNATLKGNNNALLTWKTASETNNAGFDIEMSNNAKSFVKVGFVDGKGDSKESNQYTFTVSDLAGGNYYFRLKQLDHDGKFEYSTMRALDIQNAEDIVSVYPNPTNGKLKFNTGLYKNQSFGVSISNQSGQEVLSLPAGSTIIKNQELDVTKLPTGLYNVKIQGANFTEVLKFVKF